MTQMMLVVAIFTLVYQTEEVKFSPSVVLVAGPVVSLTTLPIRGGRGSSETRGCGANLGVLNSKSYTGESGKDVTRSWPVIESVKQKEVTTVLAHTRKLSVFLGSNTSNRTPQARKARAQKANVRSNKYWGQACAQKFKRR